MTDMPWFFQNAYPRSEFEDNEFPLPPFGCGICAGCAALYQLFGNKIEPSALRDLLQWRADHGQGEEFLDGNGLKYVPFLDLLSRSFSVDWEQTPTYKEAREAIHSGRPLITGNSGAVFKTKKGHVHPHGGHVICFYEYTPDDEIYHAMDPQICGGADVRYSEEDFERWMRSVEKREGEDAGSCYALWIRQ